MNNEDANLLLEYAILANMANDSYGTNHTLFPSKDQFFEYKDKVKRFIENEKARRNLTDKSTAFFINTYIDNIKPIYIYKGTYIPTGETFINSSKRKGDATLALLGKKIYDYKTLLNKNRKFYNYTTKLMENSQLTDWKYQIVEIVDGSISNIHLITKLIADEMRKTNKIIPSVGMFNPLHIIDVNNPTREQKVDLISLLKEFPWVKTDKFNKAYFEEHRNDISKRTGDLLLSARYYDFVLKDEELSAAVFNN